MTTYDLFTKPGRSKWKLSDKILAVKQDTKRQPKNKKQRN